MLRLTGMGVMWWVLPVFKPSIWENDKKRLLSDFTLYFILNHINSNPWSGDGHVR